MKNRLLMRIRENRRRGEKLFCAFLTLGFPSLLATRRLIEAFDRQGVDILELGFPFSDPLADGPTIQFSSEYALRKGVGLKHAFKLVKDLRRRGIEIPTLFFSYFNPIFHYGSARFLKQAKDAGFDGLIIPDLPPEEEPGFEKEVKRQDLAHVFLVSPTTKAGRRRKIVKKSGAFIYYVSLRGVTGARRRLPGDVREHLRALKGGTSKPVLVGFGVGTPAQATFLSRMSDGVIVGSAIIQVLRKSRGRIQPVLAFTSRMLRAVKGKSYGRLDRS